MSQFGQLEPEKLRLAAREFVVAFDRGARVNAVARFHRESQYFSIIITELIRSDK